METIDVDIFKRLVAKEKTNVINVQKDYVLSVALCHISTSSLQKHLIFKGGTCLKKIYYPEFRFSSDLDFTATSNDRDFIEKYIRSLFENQEIEGVRFQKIKKVSDEKSKSLSLILPYISEVAAAVGKEHTDSIEIDVNFVNKIDDKTVTLPVTFNKEYKISIRQQGLQVLTIEEILAEKVHAVLNRKKPRDIYDLWYLLNHDVQINWKLIDKKLKTFDMKYSYEEFEKAIRTRKIEWARDMRIVLTNPPSFEEVSEFVLKEFKKKKS